MDGYLTTSVLSLLLKEFVAGKLKKSGIICILMSPTMLIWLIFSQRISLKGFLILKNAPTMIWFQLLRGRAHSFTRYRRVNSLSSCSISLCIAKCLICSVSAKVLIWKLAWFRLCSNRLIFNFINLWLTICCLLSNRSMWFQNTLFWESQVQFRLCIINCWEAFPNNINIVCGDVWVQCSVIGLFSLVEWQTILWNLFTNGLSCAWLVHNAASLQWILYLSSFVTGIKNAHEKWSLYQGICGQIQRVSVSHQEKQGKGYKTLLCSNIWYWPNLAFSPVTSSCLL